MRMYELRRCTPLPFYGIQPFVFAIPNQNNILSLKKVGNLCFSGQVSFENNH